MSVPRAGIYGGGPLYSDGEPLIDELRASGFTDVIAWALHVNLSDEDPSQNGDLVFNDKLLVHDRQYVGDPAFPGMLARLKESPTSVDRLLLSVGGAPPWVKDFATIQTLIGEGAQKPGGILYDNFQVLRAEFPMIDAIDFDAEDAYDQPSLVAFAQMLHAQGWGVTFCPYEGIPFWVGCLTALNTQETPDLVTAFNLQCYDGGGSNNPADWVSAVAAAMPSGFDANGFVAPGLWCRHDDSCAEGDCPDAMTTKLSGWGSNAGWVWLLDDVIHCQGSTVCAPGGTTAHDYAQAILAGVSAPAA